MRPSAGRIRILGEDPARSGPRLRRRIGYLPEGTVWIPGLSGVRGIAHLAELCGLRSSDAMLRAHDLLHFVGLGEARYREVSGYSAGMQQRWKLAAALVHDPELLFLDEPTNGLDPRGRERMLGLIERLHREHGLHLILASHLLPDVERICGQIWVLDRGKLKIAAPIAELTAAARGAQRVRLAPAETPRLAAAARDAGLEARPGEHEGELLLTRPGGTLPAEEVFTLARGGGLTLHGIKPAARSLEDAFLEALEVD